MPGGWLAVDSRCMRGRL